MGVQFAGSSKSANAPDIEENIYAARFDGVAAKVIEKSLYDPNSFVWTFTPFDENGAMLYSEDDPEPITVEGLTSQSLNVKSKTTPKAVKWLKNLMTPAEFAQFEEGETPIDAEALSGRMCRISVVKNDAGWPKVEDVLKAAKKPAAA